MTFLKEKIFDIKTSPIDSVEVKNALTQVSEREFPQRKTEDWRYAKLGKILNKNYQFDANEVKDISAFLIPDLEADLVVLVNGFYNEQWSNIKSLDGVTILPIEKASQLDAFKNHFNVLAKESQEIFTSINTAYNQGGVFVEVAKNIQVERPIFILNINAGNGVISNARNLIVVAQSSELKVIQRYVTQNGTENFNNALTEVFVKQNAKVTIEKIQDFSEFDRQVCTEEIHQEKDSNFVINTFTLSGGFVRNGLNIKVDGTNCYSEMNGLFIGKGEQFIDNHTRIDHLKSNCISSELYKGILKDSATGVFNGKVIVHKDAQVIEAYQQNKNVLLSDTATMNTKPELEIFADDVKCSHGTTTGQFDEEAIFYLQARGISKNAAKEMLIGAFANEVIEKISIDAVKDFVLAKLA